MKKFTSVLAIMMALVICLGMMAACSGKTDEETKKPTTSTSGDKNESKPSTSKPAESKPTEDKNEEPTTQPSTGNNDATTAPQPEGDANETKPENTTNPQG